MYDEYTQNVISAINKVEAMNEYSFEYCQKIEAETKSLKKELEQFKKDCTKMNLRFAIVGQILLILVVLHYIIA